MKYYLSTALKSYASLPESSDDIQIK